VIEALFNKRIFFLILFLSIPYLDDIDSQQKNFIFSNIVPLELSKTSFGFKVLDITKQKDIYLTYHTWISDNLFVDGFLSPTNENTVDITYGMNLGYSNQFNNESFRRINYTIGYFSRKFIEEKEDWSNISIIPMFKIYKTWLSLVFNYSFNDDNGDKNSKNSLQVNFLSSITKSIFLNSGIQTYENNNKNISTYFLGMSFKI
jgi:hypothetical protein